MMVAIPDRWLIALDGALRTVSGVAHAGRPMPASEGPTTALTDQERRLSGALMRVDHVGEICAQALYEAQALTAKDPAIRQQMRRAAQEETDHLAWTSTRLAELGDRPSWLNPLWYAGAFAFGLLAGRAGDRWSLAFVVETERQVEQHLAGHLEALPAADTASKAIVAQMKRDEVHHAEMAAQAGAAEMPGPVKWLMRAAAKVMTRTAHHL
jgi:ubiquinone biosynthesis monooxygenase Coq7